MIGPREKLADVLHAHHPDRIASGCNCGAAPLDPAQWDLHIADLILEALTITPGAPHVLELSDEGWTLEHPIECKLAGPITACAYTHAAHEEAEALHEATGYATCRRAVTMDHDHGGRLTLGPDA